MTTDVFGKIPDRPPTAEEQFMNKLRIMADDNRTEEPEEVGSAIQEYEVEELDAVIEELSKMMTRLGHPPTPITPPKHSWWRKLFGG